MRRSSLRPAFTVLEVLVAMALITFALGIVAGLATFAFEDRAQQNARFRALEAVNSILESARAIDWDELTPEWAASQRHTADPWLPEAEFTIKVEADRDLPALLSLIHI